MASNVCSKCGNEIIGDVYRANGIAYCKKCTDLIHKENLEITFPTPEKKLMGIIEHLEKVNDNLEKLNKPVALLLLSPQQADGVLRKSKYVSHLKAWNRRSKPRGIQLR